MTSGIGEPAPASWANPEDESWASIHAESPPEPSTVSTTVVTAETPAPNLPGPEPPPVDDGRAHPARLALGMAVLAAERVSRGAPTSEAFVTGVGLLQEGAAQARTVASRLMRPSVRMASRTVGWATGVQGPDRPRRSFSRSRELVNRVVSEARRRGEATVAAGKADASAFVQASVTDGIAWAQAQAVPQIVDGMLPHLMEDVVPRVIDGVMPEIRTRVLPAVIDDLTHDPRLRELMLEQSKGAVDEATQSLRTTTANADDKVERAFRRKGRSQTADPEGPESRPAETRPPNDEAGTTSSDR